MGRNANNDGLNILSSGNNCFSEGKNANRGQSIGSFS